MIDLIQILLLTAVCLAGLSIAWFSVIIGITPMPSSPQACAAIVQASRQAPEGTIVDLGSGWGTLLFALARQYPERRIVGYELSWIPCLYARFYKTIFGLQHVQIIRENFLKVDLPEPGLITCYLFPKGMVDLQAKLAGLPCDDILLISNTFALPNNEAVQTEYLDDLYHSPIYSYRLNHQP